MTTGDEPSDRDPPRRTAPRTTTELASARRARGNDDASLQVRLPMLGAGTPPVAQATASATANSTIDLAPVPVPASILTVGTPTGSARDLRLDALRGLCALIMIIDHIGGASYLYAVTGGNNFVVSAAEGFIFLSGLLVGLIYGARIARDSLSSVLMRILRRSATLYGLTLSLTFLFVGISRFAAMPWLQDETPISLRLLVSIVTLHRTYYLVDVMLLYTLLLLLAPGALFLLYQGQTRLVALVTFGIWAIYQVFPVEASVPWTIVNNETFQFPAWQVWFFGGMIAGYHREAFTYLFRRVRRSVVLPIFATLAGMSIWLYASEGALIADVIQAPSGKAVMDVLFDKHVARIGRLVAFGIWFPFLYMLLGVARRPIFAVAGWLLVPFGQHALYVYALHLFVVFAGAFGLPYLTGYNRENPMHNTPIQIVSVLLIWVAVRLRLFFEIIPR